MFSSIHLYRQYSCGCGFVTLNSLSLSPSGPGCNVAANVSVTATTSACVNNSWTWNTTPMGSSGSIYVGYSIDDNVPYTVTTTLNFYTPQACNTLGSAFINFTAPTGPCTSIPLPIKLKGLYQSGSYIIWETESEVNCSHYVIEGSEDGKIWKAIANTNCDNIISGSSYKMAISAPTNYIRLFQYDFDGQSFISDIIKWESKDVSLNTGFSGKIIFKGENITLTNDLHTMQIIVQDFLGKIHFNGHVQSFDSASLSPGQYIISATDKNKSEVSKIRLIVL
jgi:hypothetical protein